MSDEELLRDTSSVAAIDESQYSRASYSEYPPEQESSCKQGTYDLKSVRITREHGPQEVVVRISAKLISRREQVRQINEAIKRTSLAY